MTTVSNKPNREVVMMCPNGCDKVIGEMTVESIGKAEELLKKYKMTDYDAFNVLQEVFYELFGCDMFDYNTPTIFIDLDEKK